MAFRALLGAHGILLLVSLACIVQLGTQSEEERLENAYSNITGNPMGVLVRFLEANFYPATEFDPIPVFPINPPGTPQYKIKRCKRVDVMNCTREGGPGLPKNLQGAYWQQGLQWEEELTNAYGIWDPKIRKLIIETWKPRNWGAHDTSSRIASGKWYWLPSGASHLNFLATLQASCDVFSDEGFQHAQILLRLTVLGVFQLTIPQWFLDWPMSREPDGSWARKGYLLGLPELNSQYTLRPIVTGDLKPAKYYSEWIKDWEGRDFFYLDDH